MKGLALLLGWLLAAGSVLAQRPYFQQQVDVQLTVQLDELRHRLQGQVHILYHNNSPDTLRYLIFHLWPNAFKDHSSAYAREQRARGNVENYFVPPAKRGSMDSLAFTVEGVKAGYSAWEDNPDVVRLLLPQPLLPGASAVVETPFSVQVPAPLSRLGHVGQRYAISQWYPKPAVYDREGWHPLPYLDQGEYYNDYGLYEVSLQVPASYVVGATGVLQDSTEWAWLQQRALACKAKLAGTPITEPAPRSGRKTLHYKQDKVADFAWFADPDYQVLLDTFDQPGAQPVRALVLFDAAHSKLWQGSLQYIHQALLRYGQWVGPYPYAQVTAVDGPLGAGGGMEYPMITVLPTPATAAELQLVIVHEVGHNWFQGALGTNERQHPWMDEGINSYYEARTLGQPYNKLQAAKPSLLGLPVPFASRWGSNYLNRWAVMLTEGSAGLQPIEYPAAAYTPFNYGLVAYLKTSLALQVLADYLGQAVFDRGMQTYYQRWCFKHPSPNDLQAVLEEVSGKPLAWFFNGYLQSCSRLDFRIHGVKKLSGDTLKLRLENRSTIPLPVPFKLYGSDSSYVQWTTPQQGHFEWPLPTHQVSQWQRIVVNPNWRYPEFYPDNNSYTHRRLLPGWAPPTLGWLYGPPQVGKRTVYAVPILGANTTDYLQFGGLFYYHLLPKDRFSFHVMPLYASGTRQLAGSLGATYRWYQPGGEPLLELHSRTAFFSNLLRSKHYLKAHLPNLNHSVQRLTLRTHQLGNRLPDGSFSLVRGYGLAYTAIDYSLSHEDAVHQQSLNLELGTGYTGISRGAVSLSQGWQLSRRLHVGLRTFAAGFLGAGPVPYLLQYRLSSSLDAFGENLYPDRDRRNRFLHNQVFEDHGAFKTLLPSAGSADSWLLAGNAQLRWGKVLGLFADYGGGALRARPAEAAYNRSWAYDAGVSLSLAPNLLTLYLPLAGTIYSNGTPVSWGNLSHSITFSLTVNSFLLKKLPFLL